MEAGPDVLEGLSRTLGFGGRAFTPTAARWREDTLVVELAGPAETGATLLLDAQREGAGPAFATTSHLRISYQGRSIPDAAHRELEDLGRRIDDVTLADLRGVFAGGDDDEQNVVAVDGGRMPSSDDVGDLPRVLGLLGPDDPRTDLRLCAAEWWDDDLVIEIDAPFLRSAIVGLSRRDETRDVFVRLAHLDLSHESELDGPTRRAFVELEMRWAELDLEALLAALAPDKRIIDSPDPNAPRADDAVSRRWAAPDQWRRFFCSWELDRNILRSIRLSEDAVFVEHGDLECKFSTPGLRKRVPSFVNYPWRDVQAPPGPDAGLSFEGAEGPRSYTTDMNEADVVLGAAPKLEALIEAVSREHGDRPIHFNCTCPPIVIADEVESIVERVRGKHALPVIHTTQDPGSPLHLFASMLRASEEAFPEPDPRALNLVGFRRDRGLDELVAQLTAMDVRVNAMLIPRAPRDQVVRYGLAKAQVFFPNAPWRRLYHAAFHDLPMVSVDAPAPFGVEGVRAWLRAVAEPFEAVETAERVADETFADLRPRWDAAVEGARRQRVLFVVDGSDLERLVSPERMAGRPVLPMLDEMGFGLELLCFGEDLHEAARGHLAALPDAAGRGHTAASFTDERELDEALRGSSASAVYSEVFFDRRLTRSGKAQIHAGHFEQGMGGALRTLRRVLAVCELPFYRRLGAFLDREPAHV